MNEAERMDNERFLSELKAKEAIQRLLIDFALAQDMKNYGCAE
jgi:hypothetical protein